MSKGEEKKKHAGGRPKLNPADYTTLILERIADGEYLTKISKEKGMPSFKTVWKWMREDKEFFHAYTRAQELRADKIFEELVAIADDSTNDYITIETNSDKKKVVNHEYINRSRLRIDTRKWMLSKMMPSKYGDKLDLKHSGEIKNSGVLVAPAIVSEKEWLNNSKSKK